MYYLEDKHPDYLYALYKRVNGATPYLDTFHYGCDYYNVMCYIENMKKKHDRYNQIYYIDNDFINNYYNSQIRPDYYYKLLRCSLSDYKEVTKADLSIHTNNIITFM